MNTNSKNGFALRKADRDSRDWRRLAATILRLALLTFVLSSYWEWNHPDPGIQLMLQRERSLATANAFFLFSVLGFLGIATLVAALFHQAATSIDRQINQEAKVTRIR
jgi:hypothetical protein